MACCPKCSAGEGALEPITEHLADGTVLQTVRCIRCGERRSRKVNRYRPLAPTARYTPAKARKPCSVVGCNGWSYPGSKTGLCEYCRSKLCVWLTGQRTKPAPLLQQPDGSWIVNPERRNHAQG